MAEAVGKRVLSARARTGASAVPFSAGQTPGGPGTWEGLPRRVGPVRHGSTPPALSAPRLGSGRNMLSAKHIGTAGSPRPGFKPSARSAWRRKRA